MADGLNLEVLPATAGEGMDTPTPVLAHGHGCCQGLRHEVAEALPMLSDRHRAGRAHPVRHAILEGHADELAWLLDEPELLDAEVVGPSVAASSAGLAARRRPERFGLLAMPAPSPSFLDGPPGDTGGIEPARLDGLGEGAHVLQDIIARHGRRPGPP